MDRAADCSVAGVRTRGQADSRRAAYRRREVLYIGVSDGELEGRLLLLLQA